MTRLMLAGQYNIRPDLDDGVQIVPTVGSVYHEDLRCRNIQGSRTKELTREEAESRGLRPCHHCGGTD